MSRELIIFINSIFVTWMILYISSTFLDKKINYKDKKFWFLFIIEICYITGSYLLTDSFVRVIISYLSLILINLLLYKKDVIRIILASFATMIISLVAEILFTLILVFILQLNVIDLQNLYFGQIFTNLSIVIISYGIANLRPLKQKIINFIKNANLEDKKLVFLMSIIAFTVVVLLLYYIYFKANLVSAFILSLLVIISFAFITLFLFKEKNENYQLQIDYDNILINLKEYEKMYQLQRMKNHEYKNELSIIKGMVNKNNKKLLSYLNQLIDINIQDNKKWMEKLKRIPEEGLRGLFYYKMSIMDQEKINVDFEINRDVKVNNFLDINDNIEKKLLKIFRVYLDNAIEAVINVKEKYIRINIYLNEEKNLVISIMNNFVGNVDFECINNRGYSTKGTGRGLGLSIVQEILDTEPRIQHQTRITRNSFIQELVINIMED